ncbi:MAG: hypothetical protein U0V18_10325 [Anaerolineales bacterium]
MSPNFSSSLERAILETLAYSDVFDYPLNLDELHRYLTFPATKEELRNSLKSTSSVSSNGDFYFLPKRDVIVNIRREREKLSIPAFRRALLYGHILGIFPFVRMVSMTGSLAVLNLSKDADMDYMLVTQPGRLWLVRAFAVTFGRIMRLWGDRICVNLLVTESALEWKPQDLYSAREMCQMIPITGMNIYQCLRAVNPWIETYLPNAKSVPVNTPKTQLGKSLLQKLFEILWVGKMGDVLETWAMDFQVKKIMNTYGTAQEAKFTTDLCQGNFDNHHFGTDQSFRERLACLEESGIHD